MVPLYLFTITDYLLSLRVLNPKSINQMHKVFCLASVILAHSILLYLQINIGDGQNLSYINICSFVGWLSFIIVAGFSFYFNVYNLLISLSILNSIIVTVSMFYNDTNSMYHNISKFELLHILIGLFSLSVLFVASIQSLLLMLKNISLKDSNYANLRNYFPSLESMEKILLYSLWLAFVSLSLMLTLLFTTMPNQAFMVSSYKIGLSLIAWVILTATLLNKYTKGWQGIMPAKLVVVCAILLMVAYFGTRLG